MSVVLVLLLLFQETAVSSADEEALEESLRGKYVDQVVWVRDFRTGWRLRFDADGMYLSGGNPGTFGVDGSLRVDSVEVNPNRIELRGRRALLGFDAKTGKLEPVLTQEGLRLEFVRRANTPVEPGIAAALLTRDELPSQLPPYWSRFVLGTGDRPRIVDAQTGLPIPTADPSIGMTPRVVKRVAPVFPEQARKLGLSGSVVLRVAVDEKGKGQVVDMVAPAGFGLDQAAIDVIDLWVFEPARFEGKPVKVYLRVRFDFNPEN